MCRLIEIIVGAVVGAVVTEWFRNRKENREADPVH